MPELKPCPFCGGRDCGFEGSIYFCNTWGMYATCPDCGARGGRAITVERDAAMRAAARLWNQRKETTDA
jgi:Lar family restriction alleviation protein